MIKENHYYLINLLIFLFINSALFISNDKQWNLNNIDFEEFGNNILKINSYYDNIL